MVKPLRAPLIIRGSWNARGGLPSYEDKPNPPHSAGFGNSAGAFCDSLIIFILCAAYVITFSVISIRQHDAFLTNTRDLGNMDQPAWNTLHGRFVARTLDGAPSSRLTDHVEPIFLLVSLIFLVWDDVRALFVLQTALIALGAIPVYQIARSRFSSVGAGIRPASTIALTFVLAYLLFPALQAATLTEFHATPLAVPFLLWAFYYAERRAYQRFWLFFTLALSCQEEVALILFMQGLYMIYRARFDRRNRHAQHGALAMLISVAWFVLVVFVIIPRHSPSGRPQHVSRYEHLNSLAALISTIFAAPKIKYVGGLLAAMGGLAVLNPPALLLGAPALALNVLSNYAAMYSGAYHYSALVVPSITIASIYGGAWLVSKFAEIGFSRKNPISNAYALTAWLAFTALGYHFAQGYSPLGYNFYWPEVTPHHKLLARFAAQIPATAILSTQPCLNPHFTHRETIYDFPLVKDAEYILLDVASPTQMAPHDFHRAYHNVIADGEFEILDSADGYILLKRADNPARLELPPAFYDFARVTAPAPQYPLLLDFGDKLQLLGYDVRQDLWRRVYLRLYWQVLRDMDEDYRLYPFYYDDAGRIIEDTTARPLVAPIWYPPSQWRAGEIIRTETLPWELPARFHIGVGVVARHDWNEVANRLPVSVIPTARVRVAVSPDGTWAHLATCTREGKKRLRVHENERLYAAPRVQRERRAYFADTLALLGYNLNGQMGKWTNGQMGKWANGQMGKWANGQMGKWTNLQVQLYWQAVAEMDVDYTVFVHLVDENGALIAQHDAPPAAGTMPTTTWWGAEVVPDMHALAIPTDIAPGTYHLRVGLYDPQTLARLPLSGAVQIGAQDYVTLQSIEFK